jgi:hypothetical protein
VARRLGHANTKITAEVYAHKMRDRKRDLSFLDLDHGIHNEGAGPAEGNIWATPHPETAANDEATVVADSGD